MRWHLLLVTLLASPAAIAQTATSTSGSGSSAQVGVNAAPSQEITFNTQKPDSTSTIRNVPSIFAPSFMPTTPCSSSLSASVGFAGFGAALGGTHVDEECNAREMVRLLALIGQPDAALALVCDNAAVKRTSPQLCSRAAYVSDRAADAISSQPPVMPPAAVNPNKAVAVTEGTVGYSTDNRKYVFQGGAWRPEATATQVIGAQKDSKP